MSFRGRFPGFDNDPFSSPFFNSRPRSVFENDPFFSSNFPSFPMLGFPQLQQDQGRSDPRSRPQHHHRGNNDEVAVMDPFSMFRNMDTMVGGMMRPPAAGASHYHSSSSVMHFSSSVGGGAPKVYTATSSVTQGPGGVKETRKSESNSESGMKKMVIGHHIDDRGHVIERRHNTKKKESEQHQEFINLDEDESGKFDKEWQDRTQRYQHQQWSRSIHGSDHDHHASSRGLAQPGLLPPLNEKGTRVPQWERRSRSPEKEKLRRGSKKHHDSSEGNAARRREYVREERKVHF